MSKWVGGSGFWTWTPYVAGEDDPSEPSAEMVVVGPGEDYIGLGGHIYKTTIVKAPHFHAATQDIVNWKSNLNPENPYLEYYKKLGVVPEEPKPEEPAVPALKGEPVEGHPDELDWSVALTGIKQEGFMFLKGYNPITQKFE